MHSVSQLAPSGGQVSPEKGDLAAFLSLAGRLKAIFCDMDGTFLTTDHRVPEGAEAVIDRLQTTGVRFIPTTGRTLPALRVLFGDQLERLDTVSSNGLDVICAGVYLQRLRTRYDHATQLRDYVAASDMPLGFAVFGEDGPYLVDLEAERSRSVIESLANARTIPVDAPLLDEPICKVGVVTLIDARTVAKKLSQDMGHLFDFAPCGTEWVDVMVKGTSKVNGIRVAMQALHASDDEVACIGDSLNDYEMMSVLPHSVAVANAMPEILQISSYRIGSNRENAVLDCLERIARIRESL